ncbi:carbohydrate esterase family 5 protein [Fonsecaea pedrosoi]|nr:carbohydrate esterase family 5 protein [Fonsecaea pedrosoi]
MVSFAASCAILSLWSASKVLAQVCTPCEDVHFFLARGNNEPYPGRQGDLVAATCDHVANCGYEDLIYSALYTDLSCQTTYDGTIAGFMQMTAYADRCPNSKLILAGYSQGAQIVTDILGGGGGVSFNGCIQPSTPPLDPTTSPGNRLSAVITFGNTRHTANQPYNYGNGSSRDGLFPRSGDMLTALDAYAAITRDWCLDVDPICANNSNGIVASHLGYYNVYSDEAAAWIKSVASITDNSDFTTSIATYVSGTAQDYATVGTGTPSGVVTLASVTTESISCPSVSTPAFAAVNSTALNSTTTASRSGVSSGHSAPLTTTASSGASSSATAAATITSAPSSTGPVATSATTSAPSSTFTDSSASSHTSNMGLVLLLGLAILVVV